MANKRDKHEFMPVVAAPPGDTIKENMAFLGMNQKELAARLDISDMHLSQIMNGLVVGGLLAESDIHFNAPREMVINLTISRSAPIAPSAREILNSRRDDGQANRICPQSSLRRQRK